MISSESVEKKEPVIPRQTPRTPIHSGWASAASAVASVAFMGNCGTASAWASNGDRSAQSKVSAVNVFAVQEERWPHTKRECAAVKTSLCLSLSLLSTPRK